MSDTHPLTLIYVGTGATEWRCDACSTGLKPWPGPPHQAKMADGYCLCCFWNRAQCTHRATAESLAPALQPKAAKPPKVKPPKPDKRTCVHCGLPLGLEIAIATIWGPGHKECVGRWTERQKA
jgi:hypothetical protein